VFAPGAGRVAHEVEVPFAIPQREAWSGDPDGVVAPGDPRWTSLRGPVDRYVSSRGEGWNLRPSRTTLKDASTPAFVGVRQQHRALDLAVTLRARLAPGEETGLAVRQSERDHVRLAVLTGPAGEVVVRATHVRAGEDVVLGETRPAVALGETLRLGLQVRDMEYALTVAVGEGDATCVATADGRELDSVAAGGFIGLLLGVYATTSAPDTETVVEIDALQYWPR